MHSVGLQMTRAALATANIVLKHCFVSNAMMAEIVQNYGRHRLKTLFCYGCHWRYSAELRQIEITHCANIVLCQRSDRRDGADLRQIEIRVDTACK